MGVGRKWFVHLYPPFFNKTTAKALRDGSEMSEKLSDFPSISGRTRISLPFAWMKAGIKHYLLQLM